MRLTEASERAINIAATRVAIIARTDGRTEPLQDLEARARTDILAMLAKGKVETHAARAYAELVSELTFVSSKRDTCGPGETCVIVTMSDDSTVDVWAQRHDAGFIIYGEW